MFPLPPVFSVCLDRLQLTVLTGELRDLNERAWNGEKGTE